MARRSVSGLGRRVAFGGELEDPRRGGDLRLWRLEDRIAPRRIPVGECRTQVVSVGVFAGDPESSEFFKLFAECLAFGGKIADPGGHLGDLLARGHAERVSKGQLVSLSSRQAATSRQLITAGNRARGRADRHTLLAHASMMSRPALFRLTIYRETK
jgi:hypothetical protein